MSNTYQKRKASKEYGLYNQCKKLNDDELFRLLDDHNSLKRISSARVLQLRGGQDAVREGANKQVISSQADSLIKISRIWADFFPANTSNQPI